MANWIELIPKRGSGSRTYQDNDNPTRHFLSAQAGTRWHYDSALDGVLDATVDMSPVHQVNTETGLDVWRIVNNGFHYALGQPADKATDGWVGFGGRRGQNWFKFRLARLAYWDRVTKELTEIGGAPTYNRANLSGETHTTTVGPNNDEIIVEAVHTWANLWPAIPNGKIDASWKIDGNRIKEEISADAGAQTVIRNQYPGGPADEHFLATVFQVDWSDVPRRVIDGIVTDADDESETDGEVELRDALDRLLAFMPIDYLYVVDSDTGDELAKEPLHRRFWKDVDGNHYLLTGIRCDVLNGLPAGTWVFDPTINEQVGASSDDADRYGSTLDLTANRIWLDYNSSGQNDGFRVTTVAIPIGDTINSAYISLKVAQAQSSPSGGATIYGEDTDDAATFSTLANYDGRSTTSASVSWNPSSWDVGDWEQSPDISSVVQEIVDRAGWSSGNDMAFFFTADQTEDLRAYSYDGDSANAPKLDVTYTAGGSTYNMSATLTAQSSAPDDVVLAIDRVLAASAIGASSTPDDVMLAVERSLTATMTAQSSTPDDVMLAVERSLTATMTAQSSTPDNVVLDVAAAVLEMAAVMTAQSSTPDGVALAVSRAVSAIATATSTTPDDVLLNVTGAGGAQGEVLFIGMMRSLFNKMR